MKLNAKKLLLTGTALVAVGFATQARAANEFIVDANNDGTFTNPGELQSSVLDWTDNSKNVQVLLDGTITLTTGDTIGASTSGNAIVAGADAKTLTLRDTENGASNTTTVNGSITKGSFTSMNLTVVHQTTDGADPVILNVNGGIDLGTGTLLIDDSSDATDLITVNVTGNVNAGAINLKGDVANGIALNFTGTTAQSVTGAISNSGTASRSDVKVANAAGVTFNSSVGSANAIDEFFVDNGTNNSSVTFKGAVVNATNGIKLGNNAGTDTNTVTFDASSNNIAVTGAISATGAADTNNVVVGGGTGKTVTFNTAMGANIDSLTVNAGTKLINVGALTAPVMTLGTGATIETGGAATSTGDLNGAGTLAIGHNTTWVGNIGNTTALSAITVATGTTLQVDSAAGDDSAVKASSIALTNAGGLLFNADANKTLTVTGPITGTVANAGTIIVGSDNEVEAYTFESDIGTSASKLNTFTVATLATAQTVNFKGNVYTNGAVTLGAADVVNFTGTTQTVSGNLLAGVDTNGQVNVGNGTTANSNVTFGGTLGANAGNSLAGLKVFTGSTANVSKDVTVNAGGIDIDGTFNVDSSAGAVRVITQGAGSIDIDGTVKIVGSTGTVGNVTLTSAAGSTTIDGTLTTEVIGANTVLGSATTIGATSNTTLNVHNKIVATTAGTTIGANGRTNSINLARTTSFLTANGDVAIDATGQAVTRAAGSTLLVGIDQNSAVNGTNNSIAFADGQTITVIQDNNTGAFATGITDGSVKFVDTGLISLTNDTSTAGALKAKVVYKSAAAVVNSSVAGGAQTLMTGTGAAALTAANGTLFQARNRLLTATNAAAAQEVAESIAPTIDGGALTAALNVSNSSLGVTAGRLAALRTGETGMAAGNAGQGLRWWGQVFGQTADQSRRDGVDGFDADTYGVAVGFDTENVLDKATVGLAFSYGNTEVDSDNANRTDTEIDTYQLTLYGDYDLSANSFINAQLAYAWHDVDATRHNVGGIIGVNANGDYDADQFSARAEYGRDYKYGDALLTPSALINWTNYSPDDYTETGAGTANLTVDSDNVNVLELGLAGKASWNFQQADGAVVKPELRAGYRYDLIGDEVQTTSRFNGLPALAFNTQGADPARSTFNLGAGVKYFTTDNWEFTANYDFEYKSDYDSHAGFLRAGYKF